LFLHELNVVEFGVSSVPLIRKVAGVLTT
jgi:hypothetical protein